MAKNIRIIPRLDIKGPNLVKGIHLEGLRVLGNPEKFARYYYENGADELIYIDVVASLYNRNSLHDIISKAAREIFIPLTVGGGLRTIDDIKEVLRCGADKVSINTAAIKNPGLIKEAALKFGSSTIVVTIEAIKSSDGRYYAYTDNGREHTGVEVLEWAKKAEELGAGEILLTSVDREGTGSGYDIELVKMVAQAVAIPVIASGGPGKPEDIVGVIKDGRADAVAAASILHYGYVVSDGFSMEKHGEGNLEFIKNRKTFGLIKPSSLGEIKSALTANSIMCRQDFASTKGAA